MISDSMNAFQRWLMDEKGFSTKSARDTICRLKRLEAIAPYSNRVDYDFYLHTLNSNPAFSMLSVYVKSQLRRSRNLYHEFSKNT